MKITITDLDITKNRTIASMSGTLIDELAYSAGEATQDDIDSDMQGQDMAVQYVRDNYDYESELLANTKTYTQYRSLTGALNVSEAYNQNLKTKHTGAYVALNAPEAFTVLLEQYTTQCKEEAYQYYDSDFLTTHAPDFAKELQEAVDETQRQQYKEWLHGDHRDYAGVLSLIAKYYGADEALDYDEKTGDSVVFTFDDEYLKEEMQEYADDDSNTLVLVSEKDAKNWLISQIQSSIDGKYEKQKADNAKRKIERERVAAYKAERAATEEKERRAKLEKLIK